MAGGERQRARRGPRRGRGRPRRAGRGAPADRRAELAAAALDLFAESGLARVTMKQIAARAGVDPALIYHYYADKEALFEAAVVHAVETAFRAFRELEGDRDDPIHAIGLWLDSQERPDSPIPKMARMGLDYRRSGASIPGVDRALRHFYDEERRLLTRAVRRGLARGVFRDVRPEAFARFVSTFLDGVMVRAVVLDEDPKAAIDRFAAEAWRRLGLAKPPRRKKFIER